MKIILKIFNWIFSVFCISSFMAYGITLPSILMMILGIISLPIEAIRKLWMKLPIYKILRPVIIFILFVVFCGMLPTNNTDTELVDNSQNVVLEKVEEVVEPETLEETVIEQAETKEPEPVKETEEVKEQKVIQTKPSIEITLSLETVPTYSGSPYVEINNNIPFFSNTDMSTTSYEYYSDLDTLGRCGVVYACIGKDIMPTEERGEISMIKPSGWQTVKYPDIIEDLYLYNRCHLIGYELTGENANTKNLITGTRYMNMEMLPFENKVANYVEETGNHVMYRVSPIFDGDNLLSSGVQLEAKSVEDNGKGILFNVFCYNVQPGIIIDYATGESSAEVVQTKTQQEPVQQVIQKEEVQETVQITPQEVQQTTELETQSQVGQVIQPEPQSTSVVESNVQQNSIIANKNSGVFHRTKCRSLPKEKNRVYFNSREEALAAGFDNPCDHCKP